MVSESVRRLGRFIVVIPGWYGTGAGGRRGVLLYAG